MYVMGLCYTTKPRPLARVIFFFFGRRLFHSTKPRSLADDFFFPPHRSRDVPSILFDPSHLIVFYYYFAAYFIHRNQREGGGESGGGVSGGGTAGAHQQRAAAARHVSLLRFLLAILLLPSMSRRFLVDKTPEYVACGTCGNLYSSAVAIVYVLRI